MSGSGMRRRVEPGADVRDETRATPPDAEHAPGTGTLRSAGARTRPRLGFLGVGWIGCMRLEAVVESGAGAVACVADPVAEARSRASALAPGAVVVDSLESLLEQDLDGVVIATPSALHAGQALAALEAGLHVFCQKPLGRTAAETDRVVAAARAADRLLEVDMCYRRTQAMERVRELVSGGSLGRVYAADLVFQSAYAPDQAWSSQLGLAGGGCVLDLGIHLVDLAFWVLDHPGVARVSGTLFAGGRRLEPPPRSLEDYAEARLELDSGAVVRIACSWRLPAGQDAVISAAFYGTDGGAVMRNVDGSFYDFVAERHRGPSREVLARPPDAWSGRALVDWARRVAAGEGFDPAAQRLVTVARTLDRIYGRCAS